jgi:hypothetical protein
MSLTSIYAFMPTEALFGRTHTIIMDNVNYFRVIVDLKTL